MTLKKLYQKLVLNNQNYKNNIKYHDDNLEIRKKSNLEKILINNSNEFNTKVSYMGCNSKEMLKTLESVNLPNSWPKNKLEKALYLFKGNLEIDNYKGPINLENHITNGNEENYFKPLNKIISYYNNN
ncbi:MAG: hypothetical protein ACOCRX_01045 [Candidatus Woesearchaeota archaeon]